MHPDTRALDALSLRHLVTGDKHPTLHYNFRSGYSSTGAIVKEACQSLVNELEDMVMPLPWTKDWKANAFQKQWNVPYALGAIKKPPKFGSIFYNYYNGFFPVVLMVQVDVYYELIWIGMGEKDTNQPDSSMVNQS